MLVEEIKESGFRTIYLFIFVGRLAAAEEAFAETKAATAGRSA
jgi:hypothetical protein